MGDTPIWSPGLSHVDTGDGGGGVRTFLRQARTPQALSFLFVGGGGGGKCVLGPHVMFLSILFFRPARTPQALFLVGVKCDFKPQIICFILLLFVEVIAYAAGTFFLQ